MKSINPKDKLEEVGLGQKITMETIKPNLLTCCMCKQEYAGFGNNSQPIMNGLCCDECNVTVIMARLKQVKGGKTNDGNNIK